MLVGSKANCFGVAVEGSHASTCTSDECSERPPARVDVATNTKLLPTAMVDTE